MNEEQEALLDWVLAGLNSGSVLRQARLSLKRGSRSDAGYLFCNMIAKYSLYCDEYDLSEGALRQMTSDKIDPKEPQVLSRLYGRKKPYIYEHPIPARRVLGELLKFRTEEGSAPVSRAEVARVLDFSCPPCVLLRAGEDGELNKHHLRAGMPDGWNWGDDRFARYRAVGIQVSNVQMKVTGAVCR